MFESLHRGILVNRGENNSTAKNGESALHVPQPVVRLYFHDQRTKHTSRPERLQRNRSLHLHRYEPELPCPEPDGQVQKRGTHSRAAVFEGWRANPVPQRRPGQLAKRAPAGGRVMIAPGGPSKPPGQKSIPNLLADAGLKDLNKESTEEEIEAAMRQLGRSAEGLDSLRRTAIEQAAQKVLTGCGVSAPGKWVKSALPSRRLDSKDDKQQGQCIIPKDPDPWPDPVDGTGLLDEIVEILNRFLVLPEGAAETMALWVLFTYVHDAGQISPYLAFQSPEKRCGKTLALDIMDMLVLRPLNSSNATPAAIFRSIQAHRPTLLLDEVETFIKDRNSDLTGILNAGHRKSKAAILRTVGDNHEPRSFSVWAAKAFALIGTLPATLQDRSLVIRMKRRARDERVERFRHDRMEPECVVLKRKAFRWAKDHFDSLCGADDPDLPEGLNDREADNWRPLFAIAARVGGEWPSRARRAAIIVSAAANEVDDSVGIQILEDIKGLFAKLDRDRLSSEEIVSELAIREDRPWGEWKSGKPITKHQLARLLKRFEIASKTIKLESSKTLKGYSLDQFSDAFSRYIPSQLVTASPSHNGAGLSPISRRNQTPGVTSSKTSETRAGSGWLPGYELEAPKTQVRAPERDKSDNKEVTCEEF